MSFYFCLTQDAQLWQRDRATGCVILLEKSEDWNWETIFTEIIGLSSTTMIQSTRKSIEFGEKRKITAITAFTVIQSHRDQYQSKARMRLPISD